MSTLTPNFNWHEFNASDGTVVPGQYKQNVISLVKDLETLRSYLGNKPLIITSAYRTPKINNATKGAAPDSEHLRANAVDFYINGISPRHIKDALEYLIYKGLIKEGGIGLYHNRVHYDHRQHNGYPERARWSKI